MKAYLLHAYGSPENLLLSEVPKPEPAPGEVLVQIRATSINPYDWHHMRGEPIAARFVPGGFGKRRPTHSILGCDLAGVVEAVGDGVTGFHPGDEAYALVKHGSYAEYACVPEELLALKPRSLSFEEAAAVPMAAATALQAVRDDAKVSSGQRVLVNGASSGVGTFAVQLARAAGAEVTGVCGGRNADLVKGLGAYAVIDYTAEDFTKTARDFDALIDIAGSPRIGAAKRVLRLEGSYVVIGGQAGRWFRPMDHRIAGELVGRFSSQRIVGTDTKIGADSARNLTELARYADDGDLKPVIDRRYDFAELPTAMRYVEAGHASGKVVVTVG
ncbi:MAG: NAD(P)-dependent alcohol dehydrogenase [Hamadaea sp.]|uniref:NAD(P)-dependent alcohol dehydrogenase n=1 Tax=Hamadaea sp. TaxID=2024425 RepID=UPI0018389449|nr:NAD(P)-dependent alcohol dehydrogenase [Hamadaea sp.]NUR73251.1 NAD(P)-dependent alcohol dehydrogenase [Hamadaea sp.]NUT22899.1 NAD(P)-dependent alcohol dehydrogenase [Hamadaea sp.]